MDARGAGTTATGFVVATVALAAFFWAPLLGPGLFFGLALGAVAVFHAPVSLAALLLAWRNGAPGWVQQPRRLAANIALGLVAACSAYVVLFFTPLEPAIADGTYLLVLGLVGGAVLVGWADRAAAAGRTRLAEGLVGASAAYGAWGALLTEAEGGNAGLWLAISVTFLVALQALPLRRPARVALLVALAPPMLLLDRFVAHGWGLRALELVAFAAVVVGVWTLRERLARPAARPAA